MVKSTGVMNRTYNANIPQIHDVYVEQDLAGAHCGHERLVESTVELQLSEHDVVL